MKKQILDASYDDCFKFLSETYNKQDLIYDNNRNGAGPPFLRVKINKTEIKNSLSNYTIIDDNNHIDLTKTYNFIKNNVTKIVAESDNNNKWHTLSSPITFINVPYQR